MNTIKKSLCFIGTFAILFIISCNKTVTKPANIPPAQTVTDTDGNVYHTVTIGSQVWMVENLKTTKYRDGTQIPNVTDNTAWNNITIGAYCDYNDTPSYSDIYGRLYNGYSVSGTNNICPKGWHVPSEAEWTTLTTFLGGKSTAGGKLKENDYWLMPNEGATNESGFSALPGGGRNSNGTFGGCLNSGGWWSCTAAGKLNYDCHGIDYDNSSIYSGTSDMTVGHSVRCLKD